ncbi:MAG: hypothetical protein Q9167_001118 [Letrouitia subvulpina]
MADTSSTPPITQNDSPERLLPSIDMADESIDAAYVDFILYCNPSLPLDIDTTELKRCFRSPPMSDGKKFSPYTLFELISKLESKEIKTWTQLVIELGVEHPDAAKNQSTQKVQQYAVRLKRWLHALHVDAFFHYCLRMPNSYYTERPTKDQALAGTVRDGVPPEEDLAIRALLPEWRPKRGRKKADEGEEESNSAKKIQFQRASSVDLFHSFDEPYTAHPNSAAPWSEQVQQQDAWAAAQMAIAPKTPSTGNPAADGQVADQNASQQIRWKLNEQQGTPVTPYPQSAVTPRHSFSTSPPFEEPRSANPGMMSAKARARKRHGPAVSSAWSSSSNATPGKLRGRPPSNRSVTDGPFSTFPANPMTRDLAQPNSSTPIQRPSPEPNQEHLGQPPAPPATSATAVTPQATMQEQALARRPSKLQLQVPEHSGAPVRLATPPRVVISGESNRPLPYVQERRFSLDNFSSIDDASEFDEVEDGDDEMGTVDWKRRALFLKRKLQEKEEELKAMKRRVLEAVM